MLLFTATKTSKEDIFRYIMSAACISIEDVKAKFSGDDRTRAIRIFDVCKNKDPASMFVTIRAAWNPAQTLKVAMMHVDTPFASADEADQWLKVTPTKKRFYGPKDGSLGQMKVETDYESMYRFISRPECKPEEIDPRFDIPEQNAAAKRMFEVCHGEDFAALRAKWTGEEFAKNLCLVAHAHAHTETKFGNANEAEQFLKISSLKDDVTKDRSFSNFAAPGLSAS